MYAEAATKFSRSKPHMNIGTIGKPFSHLFADVLLLFACI
jgi:hypothetical protein